MEDLVGLPVTGRDGGLPIDRVPNDSGGERQNGDTPAAEGSDYTERTNVGTRIRESSPNLQGNRTHSPIRPVNNVGPQAADSPPARQQRPRRPRCRASQYTT